MNKKRLAVFTGLLMFLNISIFAQFISVKKDANGWRLLDDRKEIEVKGIVWSYTPIGETHTYDLWSKSDEFIERMIDTDMPMLKAMGVNAIRCAHNEEDPDFLDLCDELGLLVKDEIFDCWRHVGVAGKRQNNRKFASVFLKAGYDVVLVEYRLNDGKRDVEDELKDCAAALDYIADHAAELGLNGERCFLTGDSAGGHLALYMAEGCGDRSLPVHPERFSAKGVMINCPAYDFASYGNPEGMFTKSALSWFLGPRYTDEAWMASMSPRTHLTSLNAPLLVSTCTNDFIRGESLKLNSDCEQAGRQLEFVDIASDDKKVSHVHNVVNTSLPESVEVNERMIRFMDGLIIAGLK